MLKKVIPIVLTLCLMLGVSVMAENTNPINDANAPEISEQMPNGAPESPQGGGDNMGMPPMGDMQNGGMSRQGMNNGQMPDGRFMGNNFNGQTQEAEPMTFLDFVKTYSTPITSVILLAFAFVFVIFYRRKNY